MDRGTGQLLDWLASEKAERAMLIAMIIFTVAVTTFAIVMMATGKAARI